MQIEWNFHLMLISILLKGTSARATCWSSSSAETFWWINSVLPESCWKAERSWTKLKWWDIPSVCEISTRTLYSAAESYKVKAWVQREHISTQFYKAKLTNLVHNGPITLDIQSMKFKVQAGDRQISVDSNSCEDMVVMLYMKWKLLTSERRKVSSYITEDSC